MNKCKVCDGTEFYKEAGYYFCTECQTQNEDKREEILELRLEGTRLTKRKIRQDKTDKIDHRIQWTTWEQYNFILIGLTDELIELGVTRDLKLTVLQLWAFYLGKAEIAFMSKERKKIPKLALGFHKKDADIIYGKLKACKRKRKKATSNSSIVSSQLSETSSIRELNKHKRLMITEEYNRLAASQSSGSDGLSLASQSLHSVRSGDSQSSMIREKLKYSKHAKQEMKRMKELSKKLPLSERLKYQRKHVTTKYRTGPNVITPMKLWAIIYVALRIHKQDIHLADMLRYGREGHLSYYRLDHLLPSEMTLTDNDVKLLTQNNEITHKGMRRTCADIAKFLSVYEIVCPDLILLINRYCKDLNLPKRIFTYTKRLIALSPPKMIFNKDEPLIPNYEGRAMAFIIVVLKVLLGMDGITEYETSRIAEKINSEMEANNDLHSKLFSFREWQRYIECRRNILMQKHFPTKFKNDSDGFGNSELYVKFIKSALSRREEKPEIINYKNMIPRDLINAMEQCINTIEGSCSNSENVEIFLPSLTPQHSYLEQLSENPMYDLPDILRRNFDDTKIYYLTKPKKLIEYAGQFGIKLKIVKSRLHFIDKIVPPFERSKIPSLGEWNASVKITNSSKNTNQDLTAYLEKHDSHIFKLNTNIQSHYDTIQKRLRIKEKKNYTKLGKKEMSSKHFRLEKSDQNDFDFGFDQVTSEGKLAISSFCDLDSDNESVVDITEQSDSRSGTESLDFYKKYNLQLPDSFTTNENEFSDESFPKFNKNQKFTRDFNGRFVSKDSSKARKEPVVYKSPRRIESSLKNLVNEYLSVENNVNLESSDESICSSIDSDMSDKLFKPSEDYWMYHCIFSRVRPKNFDHFESKLPVSFQWLLNECADIIESSTEDLYEQVCMVETHFAHILRPDKLKNNYNDCKDNQAKIRLCKRKW